MRILTKKWWTLAAAVPFAAFIACSSDAPVQVMTPRGEIIDEDEYNELVEAGLIDEMGNRIEEPEDVETGSDESSSSKDSGDKTSSAGKDESSSADKDDSSSSGTGDTAKSSSSAAGNASSSSVAASSSSAKASSSSVAASSSSVAPSSSSVDQASSSSVAPATSSSAVAGVDTYETSGGDVNVGTNDMTPVDEDEKAELDDLKEQLKDGPVDGFENVGTTINGADMDFDGGGDYYCFTGEGEWLHVSLDQLGEHINHFRNGAAWGQLKKFDILFMDACEGVYFRRKS